MATAKASDLRTITISYMQPGKQPVNLITTADSVESLRRALFDDDILTEIKSITKPALIPGDPERMLKSRVAKIRGQEFLFFGLSD